MTLKEIRPGERLRPHVQCYFIFESGSAFELTDIVFPGGSMEIMFNLGEGIWRSAVNDVFQTTPPVELWGQITRPLAIQSRGNNTMLGIRFFSHSAACFFNEDIWEFNNQINDLRDVLGNPVRTLHARLMETPELSKRIDLIENFLIGRLMVAERRSNKITMVGHMVQDMRKNAFTDTMDTVASRYNITPRYLQKLFLQYTGIPPKLYGKINRFQQSLRLMNKKEISLTSIAYDCGYFDQSHFIREFKSFTGLTPSAYSPEQFPVTQVFTST
jgi:AraC-like DNA-binding protein